MSDVLSAPTLYELVQIAIDNDACGHIAEAQSVAAAREIAARFVEEALDMWEFDIGVKAHLPPAFLVIAMLEVLSRGWAYRETEFERAVAEDRENGVE